MNTLPFLPPAAIVKNSQRKFKTFTQDRKRTIPTQEERHKAVIFVSKSIATSVADASRTIEPDEEEALRRNYLRLLRGPTWKKDITRVARVIEEKMAQDQGLTRTIPPEFEIMTGKGIHRFNQHVITIGRRIGCDVLLDGPSHISRVHAILFIWDQTVLVVDPGSFAGIRTFQRSDTIATCESSRPRARRVLSFGRQEAFILDLAAGEDGVPPCLVTASPKQCIVCFEKPRQVKLGCNHFVMCDDCCQRIVTEMGHCPLCQQKIVQMENDGLRYVRSHVAPVSNIL